jgi:hypothetical protein
MTTSYRFVVSIGSVGFAALRRVAAGALTEVQPPFVDCACVVA